VDRDGAAIVLHAVDARAGEREGVAGSVLADATLSADDERLVASSAFEHVDADARARVVVESRVARLPPLVEPRLGVGVPPEELEGALSSSFERGKIDEPCRFPRQRGAVVRGKVVIRALERLETGGVEHGFILNRLLQSCTIGAVSRIARVEAWPVNVPLEATYLMSSGVVPGISRTVVRVTTDDRVVGLGEATSPSDADRLRGELGQTFVGREAGDVLEELGRFEPAPVEHRGDAKVLISNPLAGIEIALWDIAAREAGVPLYDLLGGAVRTEVPFSEYFAYRPGLEETPVDVAAFCARMVEQHDSPMFEGKVGVHPVEQDGALVREVRAAIGPERELRLDANMGWRLETAKRALALLEPFDIANMEEPVRFFTEMAELRRESKISFSAHTPDVALAASLGAPDTLVLGLGFCGGIAGTRRFIAACEAAGIGFWFYSGDLGIATATYLHVAAATPYLDRPSQSLLRWTTEDVIAGGPFQPEKGFVTVPTAPGLGVDLDEVALARCVERYAREGEYDFYSGGQVPRY
jgi:glucarate dehydratase